MAQIQGTPGYLDFPSSIIRSVWKEAAIVKSTNTPLFNIGMSKAKNATPGQAKFEMQHDFELPLTITLASGDKYNSGTNTTTYTSATNISMFQVGAYWRNWNTGQQFQVTAVVGSSATISLVGGGSITAASVGDRFEYQYFPHEQGGTIKTPISSVITFPSNATQIFATPWGVDDTTKNTLLYQGKAFAYAQRLNILRHKAEIEFALWNGTYTETTGTTGRRLYTTAGLRNIVQTNISTYPAGNLTWDLLNGAARDHVFQTGSENRFCFANNVSMTDITNIASGNIRIDAGEIKDYGLKFQRWETPGGTLAFFRTPSVRDPKGFMMFMEPSEFYLQYMQKTYLKSGIQLNNQMQEQAAFITECGVQYCPEEYLFMFTGA